MKGTVHDHIICQTWWTMEVVIARECMAASGVKSLEFIDVTSADRSIRTTSDVYKATISAQIQPNAAKLIVLYCTVQKDNDPKHTTKVTQDFLEAKKWNIFQWAGSHLTSTPLSMLSTSTEDKTAS